MDETVEVGAAVARQMRTRLRRWFRRNARDLPWRRAPREPWAVLVSEVMLQQTRADVVAGRFAEFLRRWPTPASMASSPEDDVVAAWSGLGYYGRARRLHAAARVLRDRHGGEFPRDEAALRALPGVGPYTAGAVGSLALGMPLPVVDGNVTRVLARLFAVRGDPGRAPATGRIRRIAAALAPLRGTGEWNEALMELGALVCLPGAPRCGECPLRRDCAALAAGLEGTLPETPPRAPPRRVHLAAAVIDDDRGRVLLVRRGKDGPLGGTWGLPQVEVAGDAPPGDTLARALHRLLGGAWTVGESLGTVRHSILDMRIRCRVHRARGDGSRRIRETAQRRWTSERDREALPTSSLVEKCLRAVEARGPAPRPGERERPRPCGPGPR